MSKIFVKHLHDTSLTADCLNLNLIGLLILNQGRAPLWMGRCRWGLDTVIVHTTS